MKKYPVLIVLVLLLLLCSCKKAESASPVVTFAPNPRVQSIAPGQDDLTSSLSKEKRNDGVTHEEAIKHSLHIEDDAVTLHYTNGDTVIDQELTPEESETIISFLTERRERNEATTEAFREDICFEISGYRFAIATDQSGYILNCETGKFIVLSDEKSQTMYDICAGYGAFFPFE